MASVERCRLDINQNRQLMMGCIKYEIALGRSVYEAFINFSKALGKDSMSYKEFDIIFHQFSHGKFDFDADLVLDSRKPELSDMPVELLKSILEQLGWKDRHNMRRVSKAFRIQIDGLRNYVYSRIELVINHTDQVKLVMDKQTYYFSAGVLKEYLHSPKDAESIMCIGGFKDAFALLFRLMTAPGVKTKRFRVLNLGGDVKEILKTVRDIVKSSENLIAVQNFVIDTEFEDQMVVFLSCLEPGVLEQISMSGPTGGYAKEIMDTIQWKQARELSMFGLECPYLSFLHCNRFEGYFHDLSDCLLLNIKNACFTNPNFEFCHLWYDEDDDLDVAHISSILGPEKVVKPDTGKVFSIKYEYGVVLKHNNHFDTVILRISANGNAFLRLDGEWNKFHSAILNIEGCMRPGNWKNALAHLAAAWSTPKLEIDYLLIEFCPFNAEASEIQEAVETLFKSFGYKIPVTTLSMVIDSEAQLEAVLPHLEPKTLETIKIRGNGPIRKNEQGEAEYPRIAKGFELDQWKKAWNLHVIHAELPCDSFVRFRYCTVFFHKVRENEILQIKNNFLAKDLQVCSLDVRFRDGYDVEKMKELLAPTRVDGRISVFTIEFEKSSISFKKTTTWDETDGDSDEESISDQSHESENDDM